MPTLSQLLRNWSRWVQHPQMWQRSLPLAARGQAAPAELPEGSWLSGTICWGFPGHRAGFVPVLALPVSRTSPITQGF